MFKDKTEQQVFEIAFKLISEENDRGAGLLAATMTEQILEGMLRKTLVPHHGREDKLFDGFPSVLGTFSAKIELAFRLALITADMRKLLDGLRAIRNAFAHEIFADFSVDSIRDKTENLFKVMPSHYSQFIAEWGANINKKLESFGVNLVIDPSSQINVRLRFNNYFAVIVEELHGLSKNTRTISATQEKMDVSENWPRTLSIAAITEEGIQRLRLLFEEEWNQLCQDTGMQWSEASYEDADTQTEWIRWLKSAHLTLVN